MRTLTNRERLITTRLFFMCMVCWSNIAKHLFLPDLERAELNLRSLATKASPVGCQAKNLNASTAHLLGFRSTGHFAALKTGNVRARHSFAKTLLIACFEFHIRFQLLLILQLGRSIKEGNYVLGREII